MIPPHRLPADVFAALARGEGGAGAIRHLLAAQRSKNLLMIQALVRLAARTGHPEAGLARQAYQTLTHMQQCVPRALAEILRHPMVSAWAKHTVLLLSGGESGPARPGWLAAVAGAVAVRGRVPITIDLPPGPAADQVILPALGRANLPGWTGELVRLRVDADGAQLAAGRHRVPIPVDSATPGAHWTWLSRISTRCHGLSLDLAVDRAYLANPAGEDVAWADPQQPHWIELMQRRVRGGWAVLARHHRRVAAEIAAAFTVLAPLKGPPAGLVSGTFRDAFGCIAMSCPPDDATVAVTFAHEVQHAKLAALMDMYPLADADPDERFYAPWRDDPRPLVGLLHGVYAHVGVAAFWRRQRHHETDSQDMRRAEVEYVRWRTASAEAARTLIDSECLTAIGRQFVDGLIGVLDGWHADTVSDHARALAGDLADRHRQRWQQAHG